MAVDTGPIATLHIAIMGAPQSGKTQLTRALTDAATADASPLSPSWFVDAPPLLAALQAHLKSPQLAPLQAALAAHQAFDFTLVCGLDLPSHALQGGERGMQETQDEALRNLLSKAKLPFAVVYGQGPERVLSARRALAALQKTGLTHATQSKDRGVNLDKSPLALWHSTCENCSDPACERALFTGLLKNQTY